jgi:hypothetical protein
MNIIKEIGENDFDTFEQIIAALNKLIRHHNNLQLDGKIKYLSVYNGNDSLPHSIPSISGLSKITYGLDKDGKSYESLQLDQKEIQEAAKRLQDWIEKTELVEIIKLISKNEVVLEKLQAAIDKAVKNKS